MPSKNIIKIYVDNGYYHVYNRGVEKRKIFLDEQDYRVFLSYFKLYLLPKEESAKEIMNNDSNADNKEKIISEIYKLNNYYNKIELMSFVLMPNHFHLELKQKSKREIESFMRSLITKYSKYFNKKYKRVGPLFQGRYKAVLIQNPEYLLHLSRYIHLNPKEIIIKRQALVSYPWSSYPTYLRKITATWVKTSFIMSNFLEKGKFYNSLYEKFVEHDNQQENEGPKILKDLFID